MKLTGNTILIVGGTSGIGRALAEALHDRGNRVIVAGRRKNLFAEVAKQRPEIEGIEVDLGDPVSVSRLGETVRKHYPQVNVVIANAGISVPEVVAADGWDTSVAEAVVETNILGVIRVAAALLPVLKAQQDAVFIGTTSNLAFVPNAGSLTYSASKAFVHSWLQGLRHQLRRVPVEVLELVPCYVQTELSGPQQASDPRAMPLDAYIAEVMQQLENGSYPNGEIMVQRVLPARWAEKNGTYEQIFSAINPS
ncbi:SDR family oxidoreductase [Paraburkholderia acidipaludis]|uniref:SDR family oxidoreductase n=1 Tax=Paraburkholderia acidipaludis TaxID=660537 RepID=UPI000485C460|nr:SDR family NAD(P)-dependent oxidoreductase [Paraburkholderia acidipaludis]